MAAGNDGKGTFWIYREYYDGPGGCVIEDTPIQLANGSTKKIQDVGYNDLIVMLDHDTGKLVKTYPMWIHKMGYETQYTLVTFEDGSTLKFALPHVIFNADLLRYVQVGDPTEFYVGCHVVKETYIGGEFVLSRLQVTNIEVVNEIVAYYEIITPQMFNSFANGILISEPLTMDFQNMYGFNEDLTYASQDRYDYLNGTYEGYLISIDEMIELYQLNPADIVPVRGEEWGRVIELGILTFEEIEAIILGDLNNTNKRLEPPQDEFGNNLWAVTTDLDLGQDVNDFMFAEGSEYILADNDAENFVGWYCSFDGKIYRPGDTYIIYGATHFTAVYA